LTEHDGVITPLLRGAPHLLGPALQRGLEKRLFAVYYLVARKDLRPKNNEPHWFLRIWPIESIADTAADKIGKLAKHEFYEIE